MFLAPIVGFLAEAATTLAPIASLAGTVASTVMSATAKKGGGGGTIIQPGAPAASPVAEDADAKRKRVLAMQKQMGRGSTLLTGGGDFTAPASVVGGSLRSTLGGA